MLFVVSGIGVIYSYSQRSTDDINLGQIEKIGKDIVETSERIYYVGGDSWETLKFNIPNNIKNVYVLKNYELIIEYESYGGISQAVFFSNINLTTPFLASAGDISNISSSFHPGLNAYRITSRGNYVLLEETS